jgi:hypothetical protein
MRDIAGRHRAVRRAGADADRDPALCPAELASNAVYVRCVLCFCWLLFRVEKACRLRNPSNQLFVLLLLSSHNRLCRCKRTASPPPLLSRSTTSCAPPAVMRATSRVSCTSQPHAGSSVCQDCIPGCISGAGATACSACTAGTASNGPGKSVCTACVLGYFSPSPGQSACVPCTYGLIANRNQSQSCSVCAQGTFAAALGSTFCEACGVGSYSSNPGRSACTACELGRFRTPPV